MEYFFEAQEASSGLRPSKASNNVAISLCQRRQAGKIVFEASIQYAPAPLLLGDPVPYGRYYIREKGKVEWGAGSCTQCHMRILPDGTVVNGAQSERLFRGAAPPRPTLPARPEFPVGVPIPLSTEVTDSVRRLYSTPWFDPDPNLGPSLNSNTPGVSGRPGAAHVLPLQIPDLIGVKDRKYLDHT